MHAAEAACAHEADPDRRGGGERPADGRRPDRALGEARRQVAGPELARLGREALELLRAEPDHEAAVEDADRGGHGARRANGRLAREADLDAVRRREAVRDEGRLQRDDGLPVGERRPDLVADADQVIHGGAA